jgi:hypothetical protein
MPEIVPALRGEVLLQYTSEVPSLENEILSRHHE